MATNQQRRAAERRVLQQQLSERRVREARRKRVILVSSIVATLVVVAVVVVAVVVGISGDDGGSTKKAAAGGSAAASGSAADGATVSFQGVTVRNATNLSKEPGVAAKSATTPTKLAYKDLVVGKGKAASPSATVSVQYTGVLYKNGQQFDSSWSRGQPASFSLAQVVPGFTQGIGGTTGVPPMKVGGRRIMILPSSLGYGAQAQQAIPANSPLVFVVDLKSIGS